jgi:glycosyltransferase involved in cell wall biosynthesis
VKILQILASVDPKSGGPALSATKLGEFLGAIGHDVTIYTTNYGIDGNLDLPDGPAVVRDGVLYRYFSVDWPRNYRFSVEFARALSRDVPHHDLVQIHGIYLFTTLAAAFYCQRYRIPYVITIHGMLDPFLRRKSRIRKAIYRWLFEKRCLDRAAAIHYTSEEEMELAKPLGIKAPTIVVPWGLDVSKYARLPENTLYKEQHPYLKDKKILLFLGRINFTKGLDLLCQAFGQIARRRDDIHLLIAGPDNEGYAKNVRRWLAEEGVSNKTTFTGMIEGQEKLAALTGSDVFVLPSYTDSFGMAVVEAMASGLPVVISDRVKIWREIKQAGAGIVTNCDASELEQALLSVLDDSALKKRMGINGRELVEREFRWEKTAERMSGAYEEAISAAKRSEKHATTLKRQAYQ